MTDCKRDALERTVHERRPVNSGNLGYQSDRP
jgi:hypothetical protein